MLGIYHKNFKHLPWLKSIEVARPTICGFIPKNSFFFAVCSGTAQELMVPTKPPNTHPRPHLMQKEPADFLNFPRRGTILGVENVTLYCKIDNPIVPMGIQMVTGPRAIQNTWPLVPTSNRTRDIKPWKICFFYSALEWLLTLVSQQRIKIWKIKK